MSDRSEYKPDNWIILKITPPEDSEWDTFYRVLAGWSGGYATGDSWRMNSGIDKIETHGDYYHFIGASGSRYCCNKYSECVRGNIVGVLDQILTENPDNVEVVELKDIIDLFIEE